MINGREIAVRGLLVLRYVSRFPDGYYQYIVAGGSLDSHIVLGNTIYNNLWLLLGLQNKVYVLLLTPVNTTYIILML